LLYHQLLCRNKILKNSFGETEFRVILLIVGNYRQSDLTQAEKINGELKLQSVLQNTG